MRYYTAWDISLSKSVVIADAHVSLNDDTPTGLTEALHFSRAQFQKAVSATYNLKLGNCLSTLPSSCAIPQRDYAEK